jgi:hypothetical protein
LLGFNINGGLVSGGLVGHLAGGRRRGAKWVRTSRQYVLNIYSCNNAYADVFQNDFG